MGRVLWCLKVKLEHVYGRGRGHALRTGAALSGANSYGVPSFLGGLLGHARQTSLPDSQHWANSEHYIGSTPPGSARAAAHNTRHPMTH